MIIDPKNSKKPLAQVAMKAEVTKRAFNTLEKGITLLNSYLIISSLSIFSFGFYQLILSFISILRGLGIKFFDGLVAIDMRRYFNVRQAGFAKKLFLENTVFKMGVAIIVAISVFGGSHIIAGWYGEDISLIVRWAALLLIVNSVQSITGTFLQSVVSFAQQRLPAMKEFFKLAMIVGLLLLSQFTILNLIITNVIAETLATGIFFCMVFIKRYKEAFSGVVAQGRGLMLALIKTHGPRTFFIFGAKEILSDATPWLVKLFINTEAVALYSLSINLINFAQDLIPLEGIKSILPLKADNFPEMSFVFSRSIKYTLWLGIMIFIMSIAAVPFAVKYILPNYAPALPVFFAMAAVLPIYGAVTVVTKTLGSLREYGILAMRLVTELLILFLGSAILLPAFGVVGIGLVYLARHVERLLFLYSRLVKKYPELAIRFRKLFVYDRTDRQFAASFFSFISRKKSASDH